MGVLFRVKKKLLTKAALAGEKRKLIKEAQARIESNELSQLQALRARISKAKKINIPGNLNNEIKHRKAARKRLLKQSGKNLKVGARSVKKILSELKKLAKAQKVKEVKARKKPVKRKVRRKINKKVRRKK